ncbi:hypothetical protein GC197_10500 [bacterium]|nr:hypothetical protein [bacterium]
MGVSYLVFTLNEESAAWLQENGTEVDTDASSRYPTLSELREELSRLDGYTSEETIGKNSVDFEVVDEKGYANGWSTTIWAKSEDNDLMHPDNEEEVRMTFHKGDPELAVLICEKLIHRCGPLVLIVDVDGSPLRINGSVDRAALESWLGD